MAAGMFRRRQRAPNQPLRVNASHPLAAGLGLFGWAVGVNRVWNALTGKVIDLSAAGSATGTFTRGAGDNGPTLRMAGGERGGGAIYNPTSRTFATGTLAAAFKPAQAVTGGTTRPYVVVRSSATERGLLLGMSGTASHAWGAVSSNGWLFASGSGADEQVWRTVGVNRTPGVSASVDGWLDGVFQGSAGHTGEDIAAYAPDRIWFGRDPTNYYAYPTGDIGWVGYWTRRLDRGEHRLLHEDAWSLVAPASLVQGWRFAAAAAGGDTALAGAATGTGIAAGALTTSIRLAGSPTGTGATAGALTTGIRLAASPAGAGTAAGTLTTAIALAGAATGSGTATGALAAGAAALQGAATGTGTAAGSLTTAIPLAGSATGAGVAAAALTTGIALAGAATGSGTAAASLTTGSAGLAGAATGAGVASGALTTAIRLAGAAVAAGTASGSLTTGSNLAGAATGTGIATASLSTGIALAAAPVASGIAAASLSTAIRLTGAMVGSGTATGNLIAQLPPTPGPLRTIRLRAPRALALPQPAMPALSKPRRLVG